jgi:hypothetical protein
MGTLFELTSGKSSRDNSGGRVSDSYTKVYKYIKSTPNEAYSLPAVLGYTVGAILGGTDAVCMNVSDEPDGDSRTVRIITTTFKTPPVTGGSAAMAMAPTIRPPNITFQFGTETVAATTWLTNPIGGGGMGPAKDPNGNPIDNVVKPMANGIIRVTQFVASDPGYYQEYVGTLNNGSISFGSFTAIRRTLLFKGINATPAVESFGEYTYSGWNCTYEFAYRENIQQICTGTDSNPQVADVNIGWDLAVPQTSRQALASMAKGNLVDYFGIPLLHVNGAVQRVAGGPIAGKYDYAKNPDGDSVQNEVVRAMVVVPAGNGGFAQVPSSDPIPVNDDGSPRKRTASPPVLVYRRGTHREIDFRNTLGLR